MGPLPTRPKGVMLPAPCQKGEREKERVLSEARYIAGVSKPVITKPKTYYNSSRSSTVHQGLFIYFGRKSECGWRVRDLLNRGKEILNEKHEVRKVWTSTLLLGKCVLHRRSWPGPLPGMVVW